MISPAFDPQLMRWRHHLHRQPAPGFEERQTADDVPSILSAPGLPVHRGVGGTGVVASLTVGEGPCAIGLRADSANTKMPRHPRGPTADGHREAACNTPLHSARYDFNDCVLPGGARDFAERARIRLPR